MLTEARLDITRQTFGVVVETVVIEPRRSGRIVVRCSDGTVVDEEFNTSEDLTTYVGTLVVIEHSSDGGLTLQRV